MVETRQCVVFATPGLIPLEAFTTFGVNVKPNSTNPFGFFGTGLKYAVAVLLRHGCEVVVWRGAVKYVFYISQRDFRGKGFTFVRMKKSTRNWKGLWATSYSDLPFTLELGKNWELWQAFRELHTNTLDEGGKTYILSDYDGDDFGPEDNTHIVVYGSKFIDEFHDRHRNFLPDGETERSDQGIQVIDRPSKHIYYRGVRIMDLKEEAEHTYNFLRHVDLTEDRTAKHPLLLEMELCRHIMESEDEPFVRKAVGAPVGRYESRMNFGYVDYVKPSRVFRTVAERSPNPTIREIWDRAQPTVPDSVTLHIRIPRSEVTDPEMEQLRQAVAMIWNLDEESLEIKNMAVPEEVAF